LQIVEEGTGKRPMIYTAAYFWRDSVGDTGLGDYPLWIANYGPACPLTPDGWDTWTIWQYCDGNTDYCTNGLGFDRDVFNGTSDDLAEFASGDGASYTAELVDQSFSSGTDAALSMEIGEVVSGHVELRNTGTATWGSTISLGTTQPDDRDSPFATEDWIAPSRPAAVAGSVEPGQSYRFEFDLQAPSEAGTFTETFWLVTDGGTWFDDPGQSGGIQLQIEVSDPDADPANANTGPSDPGPEGSAQERPGPEFPPLVGTSTGVDGGCAQGSGPPSPGWVLAFLGLIAPSLRRWRR
jgi:lysozyme